MKKQEVEQILIIVKSGQSEAISIKIYKNGIICRRGCGGLPEIGISGMSFTENSEIFDHLMNFVPQQILDKPVHYQDEIIHTSHEYIVAFYGVSNNGETGEDANWTKSTGLHFLIDLNTSFTHPLLGFCDAFSMEATEQTNSLYFDVIIKAVYEIRSTTLPQTILSVPATENEIQADFHNYVNQMNQSTKKWDLTLFAKNKIYVDPSENKFLPNITKNGDSYHFNFVPVNESKPSENLTNNKYAQWWKFW